MRKELERLIKEYQYIQSDSSLIYDSGSVSDYQNGYEEGKYLMLEKVIKDLEKVLNNSR